MAELKPILLQEIVEDLIDENKSLRSPLLKLKYFAMATNNKDLLNFVQREMEGFRGVPSEGIPSYRRYMSNLTVDLYYAGETATREITADILENEKMRDYARFLEFRQGIVALEQAHTEMQEKEKKDDIKSYFPPELYHDFEEGIRKVTGRKFQVRGVTQTISRYSLNEVLLTVRSKLLELVMEISNVFGFEINIEKFNKDKENNIQKIEYIMNKIINTGDGNVVNTGDHAHVSANITINKNDWQALQKTLEGHGVDGEDIEELNKIVQEEKPEGNSLGQKAIDWILKVSGKALKGVGKIATGVSSNLLASFIKEYYGMGG